MTSNPYSSPATMESEHDSPTVDSRGCGSELAWLVLPPLICAIAGFGWYVIASLFVEILVMPYLEAPKYSYGGPAIFLFLPLSTFYGLLTGLATTVLGLTQRRHGGIALIVVAVVTVLITAYWWFQFENATECNSKFVLFYPLFTLSSLIGVVGVIMTLNRNTKRLEG